LVEASQSVAQQEVQAAPAQQQRAIFVLLAGALPWLAVIFAVSGLMAGLQFAAYALLVLAAGSALLMLFGFGARRPATILLAPSFGIFILSSLSALALRGRFSVTTIALIWGVFGLIGAAALWRQRSMWAQERIPYGRSLIVLSVLICVIYFVPVARRDAVYRTDGSFNWIYVDTQHFYAIAAGIKGGERPPVGPGSATEPLRYHFGPYAPAGILSAVTGLPLGDALARVTRGASQWALVFSCFALGTLLARRATGEAFGGIVSVAGLFFYGSLLALFANERNSASSVNGAILHAIPGVEVAADGGPFSHILLGHSVLHGLGAITVIMGLCLLARAFADAASNWFDWPLVALPALAIPVNSVAALYSLGIVGILLFWGRLRQFRSWISILGMFIFFLLVWKMMGLSHAPDSAGVMFDRHFASQWWTVVVAFLVGLGLRLIAFRWIQWPLRDPMSALLLATVFGLFCFGLFVKLPDGNQHYGFYYLDCMMSLLAFCRIPSHPWRVAVRTRLTSEWFSIARIGMLVLAVSGVILAGVSAVMHRHTGVKAFVPKLLLTVLLFAVLAAVEAWMRRHAAGSMKIATVTMAILLLGFFAWIAPWTDFAMGHMQMDVTLSPGEVQGLARFRVLSHAGEEFATNEHAIATLAERKERSYAYMSLSERPVLLEGYLDRGVEYLPWFSAMQSDNALLFTTTDPNQLHQIADRWHVRWLVARPGTDISLGRPLPPWLIPQTDTGSLKIYEVR
jgi:hypothetical protein